MFSKETFSADFFIQWVMVRVHVLQLNGSGLITIRGWNFLRRCVMTIFKKVLCTAQACWSHTHTDFLSGPQMLVLIHFELCQCIALQLTSSVLWWNFPERADRHLRQSCMLWYTMSCLQPPVRIIKRGSCLSTCLRWRESKSVYFKDVSVPYQMVRGPWCVLWNIQQPVTAPGFLPAWCFAPHLHVSPPVPHQQQYKWTLWFLPLGVFTLGPFQCSKWSQIDDSAVFVHTWTQKMKSDPSKMTHKQNIHRPYSEVVWVRFVRGSFCGPLHILLYK